MAILKSAKKALRAAARRKVGNDQRKKTLRETIKKLESLAKNGALDDARALFTPILKRQKSWRDGRIPEDTQRRAVFLLRFHRGTVVPDAHPRPRGDVLNHPLGFRVVFGEKRFPCFCGIAAVFRAVSDARVAVLFACRNEHEECARKRQNHLFVR